MSHCFGLEKNNSIVFVVPPKIQIVVNFQKEEDLLPLIF